MSKIKKYINPFPSKRSYHSYSISNRENFEVELKWYVKVLAYVLYPFGFNLFVTEKTFAAGILIKLIWICIVIHNMNLTSFNFVEGFIAYSFLFMYFFHIFDVFIKLFLVIFVPEDNHHRPNI